MHTYTHTHAHHSLAQVKHEQQTKKSIAAVTLPGYYWMAGPRDMVQLVSADEKAVFTPKMATFQMVPAFLSPVQVCITLRSPLTARLHACAHVSRTRVRTFLVRVCARA